MTLRTRDAKNTMSLFVFLSESMTIVGLSNIDREERCQGLRFLGKIIERKEELGNVKSQQVQKEQM